VSRKKAATTRRSSTCSCGCEVLARMQAYVTDQVNKALKQAFKEKLPVS
jgi:hypothetical protein